MRLNVNLANGQPISNSKFSGNIGQWETCVTFQLSVDVILNQLLTVIEYKRQGKIDTTPWHFFFNGSLTNVFLQRRSPAKL